MSWLCLFTLSCLSNPTAPMTVPDAPPVEGIPVSAQARPASGSSTAAQPLSCELRQVRRDGGKVMLAVIRTSVPVEGEYEFSVGARDAGRNTVSSSTGDAFRIRAGERLELEGPSVSLGRGTAVVGRLDLRDEHGKAMASCSL